jgi:hypothetical protein
MQAILKCEQNIYSDIYQNENTGHFNTAGNFKFLDALIYLDISFSKILFTIVSSFKRIPHYSYEEILNCFQDSSAVKFDPPQPLINPILEKVSDHKNFDIISKEFIQMQNTNYEYVLFRQHTEKLYKQTKSRKEQRYKDSEVENVRLRNALDSLQAELKQLKSSIK